MFLTVAPGPIGAFTSHLIVSISHDNDHAQTASEAVFVIIRNRQINVEIDFLNDDFQNCHFECNIYINLRAPVFFVVALKTFPWSD